MRVGEVCNREVVIADRADSVLEAAKLMRRHHVGDLVAVEEQAGRRIPVGILTDRDLVVEVLAREVDPNAVCVGDAMSGELLTAVEAEDFMETVKRMRQAGVRRMPVVDAEGGLVGILAVDDVLELIAEELTDLVGIVAREQRAERTRRPA